MDSWHQAHPTKPLLSTEAVDALQELARTWEEPQWEGKPLVLRSAVGTQVSLHPLVLWIVRSYLQTNFQFGHSPGFATIQPGGGTDGVGNWHSDWPYHPTMAGGYADSFGSFPTEIPFGLQFNTCVTSFSNANGATAFRLRSHTLNRGPPPEWHAPDQYAGGEATQFSCPAGTIILYDAR